MVTNFEMYIEYFGITAEQASQSYFYKTFSLEPKHEHAILSTQDSGDIRSSFTILGVEDDSRAQQES